MYLVGHVVSIHWGNAKAIQVLMKVLYAKANSVLLLEVAVTFDFLLLLRTYDFS